MMKMSRYSYHPPKTLVLQKFQSKHCLFFLQKYTKYMHDNYKTK